MGARARLGVADDFSEACCACVCAHVCASMCMLVCVYVCERETVREYAGSGAQSHATYQCQPSREVAGGEPEPLDSFKRLRKDAPHGVQDVCHRATLASNLAAEPHLATPAPTQHMRTRESW